MSDEPSGGFRLDESPPAAERSANGSLRYIFLAAFAGAAGTALVGIITSSTTLNWVGGLVTHSNLPKGAIIFVTAPDCGAVGDGWRKYELAEGRFLLASDSSHKPGLTREGKTVFKLRPDNLPPFQITIPYRFSNTSASNGGFPLVRNLGPTGADSGTQYLLDLPFAGNEIDVTPPSIALLACEKAT